jgi:outer membrane lipoprotein-sorting protein
MRSPGFLLPLLFTLTAYAADPALQAVFDRMDKAAANFKGFTADVVKIDHQAIIDDNDKQTGTIAVRKPTPRSFQYLEKFPPDGEQVEINDTRVQIYHPRTKTLQADDVGKKYKALEEEVLLLGFGGTSKDLLSRYQVSMGGTETIGDQPATRLILIPKDPQLAQTSPKFEVWLSNVTGLAVQQKWYDKGLLDYHVQTYSNMKIGPVAESQVKLVLPKDVHKEHLIR